MSCPERERLAAAAAGEDNEAAEHALSCAVCRGVLDDQRAMRRQLAGVVTPPLANADRERMAAGIMAQLDAQPVGRRASSALRGGLFAAAAVLIIGAVGLLVGARQPVAGVRVAERSGSGAPAIVADTGSDRAPAVVGVAGSGAPSAADPVPEAPRPAIADPPARRLAAATANEGARFVRATNSGRDVIELGDGEITIDSRDAAPTEVRLGATAIRVADAKVTVRARRGVLATVSVFAGAVEMSSATGSTVVSAGTIWEAPESLAPPVATPVPATTDPAASLAAFRDGWIALRDGRYGAAIAAFDRARSPVIHEDAMYWAAVAASRAGYLQMSRRRFTQFLARFPDSPWADTAQQALGDDAP